MGISWLSFGYFITLLEDNSADCFSRFDVEYQLSAYRELYYGELGIYMPVELDRAVDKRKSEFLVGRYAAKQCLLKQGWKVAAPDFKLEIGKHRAPIWPEGIVGSISHTSSKACVIVASSSEYKAIGVDIENWIEAVSFDEFKNQILTDEEGDLINNIQLANNKLGTLIFSAKESLFKALYPYVGEYFGFHDAGVQGICFSTEKIQLTLRRTLGKHPLIQMGRCFDVEFHIGEGDVFTKLLIQ